MRPFVHVALLVGALWCGPVHAHPLAPSLVELREGPPGASELLLRTPLLRAAGAELAVDLEDGCRLLDAPAWQREGNALVAGWRADCGEQGPTGALLRVEGLGATSTQALVRIVFADGRVVRRLLDADHPELRIPEAETRRAVAADHLVFGFRHLLTGLDHLLFVVGLCVLLGRWRRLLPAVTAFTLGHSLTLGLVVLGFARVPSAPTELAIAGSVLLLACELARRPEAPPGILTRHAFSLPFAFGLLHGLGFAGALEEAGVPGQEVPLALFSFNVGIELGQLLVVLVAISLGRALFPGGLPARIRALPAYTIGCLAAFWCFERASALL
jgi:hydrogenase/urease accessory protein HupE